MTQKDILLNLMKKNGGIITTSEAVQCGIRKNLFSELVKSNDIVKLAYGLYSFSDDKIDEYIYLTHRLPKAIFSHDTAAYLHGLTNRMPIVYTMTVKIGSNVSRMSEDNMSLRFSYVSNDIFQIGKSTVINPFGREISVYNKERTILDLIKAKEKVDRALFSEVLNNYFDRKDKNLLQLSKYAIAMKIEDKLRNYTEVLL